MDTWLATNGDISAPTIDEMGPLSTTANSTDEPLYAVDVDMELEQDPPSDSAPHIMTTSELDAVFNEPCAAFYRRHQIERQKAGRGRERLNEWNEEKCRRKVEKPFEVFRPLYKSPLRFVQGCDDVIGEEAEEEDIMEMVDEGVGEEGGSERGVDRGCEDEVMRDVGDEEPWERFVDMSMAA